MWFLERTIWSLGGHLRVHVDEDNTLQISDDLQGVGSDLLTATLKSLLSRFFSVTIGSLVPFKAVDSHTYC